MKISEVQPGMMGVSIKGQITDISEPREVKTRYGTQTTVAEATVGDDSGTLKLTLWADQINKVKVGDKVEIVNGLAKEWQGNIQLSVGKRGELKINP